jgi:phage repressor protein C with HTH and peptisase S24 domain
MLGERRNEFRGPSASPGVPLVGTGDCAELDATDPSGHHVRVERSSFDPDFPIRFLERPPALLGSRNAYAIYFHGTSMEHRFYAGEIGYVDPDRHASPSDFVVVQLTNGAGDEVVSVLVKRLVRQTPNYVELEQFNPPLIFRIERRLVARMHRILPPSELFNR